MKISKWITLILIYILFAAVAFLFAYFGLEMDLFSSIVAGIVGGFVVPLLLVAPSGSSSDDTNGRAYYYSNLYDTDLATGRKIAELEKLNKNLSEANSKSNTNNANSDYQSEISNIMKNLDNK